MDLITGKGPSKRHEIFYFAESTLGAVRIDDFKYRFIDQPSGWLGGNDQARHARSWSTCASIRSSARAGRQRHQDGSQQYFNWFTYEFWRFVFVQQEVGEAGQTAIEFPPMQKGASFNLEAVKAQIAAAQAAIAK